MSNRAGGAWEVGGGILRATLVLALGAGGILLLQILVHLGLPVPARVPPGRSPAVGEDTGALLRAMGTSLVPLLVGCVLGLFVGLGLAWMRTALTNTDRDGGRLVGGLGWVAGMLWTAPAPAALTALILAAVPSARLGGPLVTLAALGLVATLVSVSAGARWRRHRWGAGWWAGVGAAGRAGAAAAGALIVVEPLTNSPGLGYLVAQAIDEADAGVLAAALTTLLLIALAGQLLGAIAMTVADHLDGNSPPTPPASASLDTALRVLALATLAFPVLLLAASAFARDTTLDNIAQVRLPPSPAHLLGTDQLGRDVLARLLAGFRLTLLTALAAALVATVLGGIWGGLAAIVRRLPWGGPIAELVIAPGRLLTAAPLLAAGLVLLASPRVPAVLALALLLTPRVAAAVLDLSRRGPMPVGTAAVRALGLLLVALAAGLSVLVALEVLGLSVRPPTAVLGGVLGDSLAGLQRLQLGASAIVTILVTGPLLAAGWTLLHPTPADEALADLQT